MRTWIAAKLHGITVTEAVLDYHGSVTIDAALMQRAQIRDYEQCHVVNLNNGNRWVTYALPGDEGVFAVNGGGARLALPGDRCVVMTYQTTTDPVAAQVLELGDGNLIVDEREYLCVS